MEETAQPSKDSPWLMRTYSGYASAAESNRLYRANLAKGQTGLSIAFDLPTQTGYDSDHVLARGEVGKLGVPMRTREDMEALFDQIPVERMNTSMTINAPTAWVLALYLSLARQQGADLSRLRGTTQNDILKEYLSRGTYIFPPKASIRLAGKVIRCAFTTSPNGTPSTSVPTTSRSPAPNRCRRSPSPWPMPSAFSIACGRPEAFRRTSSPRSWGAWRFS